MSKNLVIVESPAKAKTIEKYLGSEFTVLSSIGHIRSIAKKTKDGREPIDVNNGFETVYEIDPDKKKTIAELRKAVKAADTVWLATDEDREGEAIAWHLCEVLKLDPARTKRIVFHEITKDAIEAAIQHPRTVDMHLVRAQQARQILDRIVGFELSPVVWQKVPGGKSAGRVQSPAVRLIVEREREIRAFESSFQFKVTAEFASKVTPARVTSGGAAPSFAKISDFSKEGADQTAGPETATYVTSTTQSAQSTTGAVVFKAELPKRFDTETEAKDFLESLVGASYEVSDVTTTPGTRNPSAPFTTSTLQQEANAKLGFGSKATMASAQKLYQDGKITYMRTDSVTLSKQAMAAAAHYIESTYGKDYVQVRAFKTKSASAQEAHEAIRPTDMSLEKASSNDYDQKLYDLIRRRTLASQMAPAKLEKTEIAIAISRWKMKDGISQKPHSNSHLPHASFIAKGEVVIFPGFLAIYGGGKDDNTLPALTTGEVCDLQHAEARQTFARPPARYSEGSLVKKLEELGIGRPSTYATIINTVQTRGYVERGESEGQEREVVVLAYKPNFDVRISNLEEPQGIQVSNANIEHRASNIERSVITERTGSDRGKLVPTPAGELIADFLTDHFEPIVDYGFTASVEEHFDDIASDKLERNRMLADFYTPFHSLIEKSGDIDRSTVGNSRTVGTDPRTGRLIIARFGRYGPMLQLGEASDEEKPSFAPMPKGASIDTVTLDQALESFKLPRVVGLTTDGQEMKANNGRFGPYVQVGKVYVSIKPHDPMDITETEARELYEAKLKADAEKTIADFGDGVKILNGHFGPYITDGKANAKIPKDTDPKTITHDEAKKLLAEAPSKPARHRFTRRKKK